MEIKIYEGESQTNRKDVVTPAEVWSSRWAGRGGGCGKAQADNGAKPNLGLLHTLGESRDRKGAENSHIYRRKEEIYVAT